MTAYQVADGLALDSAGTDGAVDEVSQIVTMDGRNGVQIELLVYALTATDVTVQLQVSNDMVNWDDQGSAQTMTAIGRKVLTADTSVAATHVRVKFSLTGSGKAILRATLHVSQQ